MLSHLLNLASKHRTASRNIYLGAILAFIAGSINAGGFFLVQQYTSHMTGIISIAADHIALGKYLVALEMISYIALFILGSIVSTIITLEAKKSKIYSVYAIPLLLEAILLILIVVIWAYQYFLPFQIKFFIGMLCFLMGIQNALITKASSAIIRTTHITGMSTDLGIEIGRYICGHGGFSTISDKNKAQRHAGIILCFFCGGVIGAFGVKLFGIFTFLPLSFLLIMLCIHPILRDITFAIQYAKRLKRIAS